VRYYTREAACVTRARRSEDRTQPSSKCPSQKDQTSCRSPRQSRQVSGRAPLPLPQGRGHEPRLASPRVLRDEVGGRAAHDRSRCRARQGKLQHTGQLGGVMQESIQRDDRGSQPCAGAGPRARVLPEARCSTCTSLKALRPKDGPTRVSNVHGAVSALHQIPVRSMWR